MKKIKNIIAKSISDFFAIVKSPRAMFCNIAEGTHAGSITKIAGENIDSPNLIVKIGANENEVVVAGAADKPLGIATDEAESGEAVAVALSGCAESTFICTTSSDVSAGNTLYSAAGGKVSAIAANGSYKIGVALCNATTGGVVEIDPRGFGESAYQFYSCGIYSWKGATNSNVMSCSGLTANDIVVATIQAASGSEKTVKAVASATGITFTLDANGAENSTKISWIAIRKN